MHIALLALSFLVQASLAVHAYRTGRERWMYLIILVPVIGSVIYVLTEVQRPDPELDDQRRRYYRLTALGVRVLDSEIARMEHLARTGRQRRAVTRRNVESEGS